MSIWRLIMVSCIRGANNLFVHNCLSRDSESVSLREQIVAEISTQNPEALGGSIAPTPTLFFGVFVSSRIDRSLH